MFPVLQGLSHDLGRYAIAAGHLIAAEVGVEAEDKETQTFYAPEVVKSLDLSAVREALSQERFVLASLEERITYDEGTSRDRKSVYFIFNALDPWGVELSPGTYLHHAEFAIFSESFSALMMELLVAEAGEF